MRKCTAVVSSQEEAMEVKALVENEKTKNYSDMDDIEFVKFLGAQPLESDKLKLLTPILDGSVP